jgi:hypothetical protein
MVAVLTEAQRIEFARTGIVKLAGAFGARHAARMRDVVWNELHHRYGIEREDPATWDRHPPTGLKSTKRSRAFAPIASPAVVGALDDLLGVDRWRHPPHYGNVLVTMPNATEWRVPHRVWHSDFEATYAPDRVFAVKLWALFGDVAPGGGGTPQLAGSHRLCARFVADRAELAYKPTKLAFLRSHPGLRALTRDDGDAQRNAVFMDDDTDVDGIPARVVELAGDAGDVFITHAWVFHSIAANATDHPRLMRSVAIHRVNPSGAPPPGPHDGRSRS